VETESNFALTESQGIHLHFKPILILICKNESFLIKQIYSSEIRKLFRTVFDELESGAKVFAGETSVAHDTVHLKEKNMPSFYLLHD
jgi:hypothetical protein